jgi:flagellar hook assembly protein FlgD
VAKSCNVQIKIYNQLGQLVRILVNEDKTAGEYSFTWDGRDAQGKKLAGGIYFYRLTAGGQVFTKKMLYLQ